DHLAALVGAGGHGGEQQFAFDRVVGVQFADLDDIDELEELLGDLFDGRLFDVDDDGDAAEPFVVGWGHREGDDVEAAPGEEPADTGQHAGPVLDQHRERLMRRRGGHYWTNLSPPGFWDGCTTTSSLDAPAGTMGNTFSWASVRKSITTGRSSMALAF